MPGVFFYAAAMIPAALYAAAAALSAVLAIAAEWEERRHRSFYLLKPLTTTLILAAALAQAPASGSDYQHLVAIALALSLVGDACLMFDGDLWFAGGLGSFLLAHVGFILAFLKGVPLGLPPAWTLLTLLYGMGLCAWLLPRAGSLRLPVAVYCLVLLGMTLAAALRFQALYSRQALLALAGALLFAVSDSSLAVRRFGGPYRGAQALILSTYWVSIGLIAASV
jgi:alkenylglycerophosphocholine/alkenylglycerophosphoethanolamine hydrolase